MSNLPPLEPMRTTSPAWLVFVVIGVVAAAALLARWALVS